MSITISSNAPNANDETQTLLKWTATEEKEDRVILYASRSKVDVCLFILDNDNDFTLDKITKHTRVCKSEKSTTINDELQRYFTNFRNVNNHIKSVSMNAFFNNCPYLGLQIRIGDAQQIINAATHYSYSMATLSLVKVPPIPRPVNRRRNQVQRGQNRRRNANSLFAEFIDLVQGHFDQNNDQISKNDLERLLYQEVLETDAINPWSKNVFENMLNN